MSARSEAGARRGDRVAGSPSAASARVIGVDALGLVLGGGISVAQHLIAAMAHARPEARFLLWCSAPALARAELPRNVEVRWHAASGLLRRTAFQQLALPRLLRAERVEVLLALGGWCLFASRVPQVCVWQNPNVFTRVRVRRSRRQSAYIVLQRWVQRASMRKAALSVFLTRDSVREAATRWPMARIPHRVIPLAIPAAPAPAEPERSGAGAPRFALAVGHSYFHKNYETLIDAMAQHRDAGGELALEIAGGAVDAGYHRTLEQRIAALGLADRVRFLGPVSPETLSRLYLDARLYVVTSRLESFGLTPLEAMAHDLPVLAARASCTPEVCGDAALYCDPDDPRDVAHKLERLATDEELRAQLRARGRRRLAAFDWPSRAQAYLAALDACLPGGGRGAPCEESTWLADGRISTFEDASASR